MAKTNTFNQAATVVEKYQSENHEKRHKA